MNHPMPLRVDPTGSPFDQIKRTDGAREYWSARDLMPLLGYEKWERFAGSIDRARTSLAAQGLDPEVESSRLRENLPGGTKPREDFHLSRFAAYLVAMNGDPRKREIAAAQAYFAVRTREAETAPTQLTGPALMAAALIEAEKTLAAAREEVRTLTPKAQSFDHFLSSGDDYAVSRVAQALVRAGAKIGRNRLFTYMKAIGWIYKPEGQKFWHAYQRVVDQGLLALKFGKYEDLNTGQVHGTQTIRITPKGVHKLAQTLGVTITEGDLNEAA